MSSKQSKSYTSPVSLFFIKVRGTENSLMAFWAVSIEFSPVFLITKTSIGCLSDFKKGS